MSNITKNKPKNTTFAAMQKSANSKLKVSFEDFKKEVINDYKTCVLSRETSLLGRKEVLTGKAGFGIFGDGKELPQVVLSKFFQKGDFRSGYYRDQTIMMAVGGTTIKQMFAQLYANPDIEKDPFSGGRNMNNHFATRLLDEKGEWKNHMETYNTTSDMAPTAGQMPRLLGLAQASKLYRNNKDLHQYTNFSNKGNEIAWGTIGNASTSEGAFWEVMNAAGVLQVPIVMSIWDDEYGISVSKEHHTIKGSISEALAGFASSKKGEGFLILTAKAWDYKELIKTYEQAEKVCREEHKPVLVHITEVTQPQGHSTSGSHERYKSKDRLEWERANDCNKRMAEWMVDNEFATEDEVNAINDACKAEIKEAQKEAWKEYLDVIKNEVSDLNVLINNLYASTNAEGVKAVIDDLKITTVPHRKDIGKSCMACLRATVGINNAERQAIVNWYQDFKVRNEREYSSFYKSESKYAVHNLTAEAPTYDDDAKKVDGREVVRACFDDILGRDPRVFAFGEDVGHIGDVNQGLAGMQEKYGNLRVSDTGIRELSIMGQAMGTALRGLRPIAEIQYLDYLLYGLQTLSDDAATIQYRTKGGQKYPIIIRTRGHRLEGIWHSGSPMGMIINSLRGFNILVPRNMTQAAAYYNTLIESDEPALVIECLNGYRIKEKMPNNVGTMKLVPGVVETMSEGTDITMISYGSTLRICEVAVKQLATVGVSVELIDAQSLLPFDTNKDIVKSLEKTNRLVVVDEDVPGGASAFILKKILEDQNGYFHLDSKPMTITAKPHRSAYATDGDYFSKPSAEEIFEKTYSIMEEFDVAKFPKLF